MFDQGWFKRIFPQGRELRWVLPLVLIIGAVILQWLAPEWSSRLETWTVDARFGVRGAEQPGSPIVLVALDEASFQMLGDLQGENIRTWPRGRWAELVNTIANGHPRVIALDVVFDTPGWDVGGDQALADALMSAGNVILVGHIEQITESGYRQSTFSPPLGELAGSAAGWGVANYPVDIDGGIRSAQLLWSWETQILPSFPVAVAVFYNGAALNIDFKDLGGSASLPINYRGSEATFETVSMVEVWNGTVKPEIFANKIVLVGYTTRLEQDRHLTPFAGKQKLSGVEIHANVIENLLVGDWMRPSPPWLALVLVATAGLIALALGNIQQPVLSLVAILITAALYLLLGQIVFSKGHFILSLASPLLTLAVVSASTLAERMVFAERDKRRMRQRFASMMSPQRLNAVMDHWDVLCASDRPPKEAAVMFTDLRGFTHATESLMRQGRSPEMVGFLGAYLDAMSQAIFEEGGVIYRMVGDGLLIMFGVPESLPDYALRSVRSAVHMAQALQVLAEQWPLQNESPLQMGIGIHCGQLVDAIIGRGRQVDYAIIGDAANTAARIESHTKVVGDNSLLSLDQLASENSVPANTTILISADIYHQVQDHVIVDKNIPAFEARGKAESLTVMRLLGLHPEA